MENLQQEIPSLTLWHDNIKAINDPEALGVYTYMKMLMDCGKIILSDMIKIMSEHFKMTEDEVLKNIRELNKLGLIMVSNK